MFRGIALYTLFTIYTLYTLFTFLPIAELELFAKIYLSQTLQNYSQNYVY